MGRHATGSQWNGSSLLYQHLLLNMMPSRCVTPPTGRLSHPLSKPMCEYNVTPVWVWEAQLQRKLKELQDLPCSMTQRPMAFRGGGLGGRVGRTLCLLWVWGSGEPYEEGMPRLLLAQRPLCSLEMVLRQPGKGRRWVQWSWRQPGDGPAGNSGGRGFTFELLVPLAHCGLKFLYQGEEFFQKSQVSGSHTSFGNL